MSIQYRLFNPATQRYFDIVIDHSMFDEKEFHLGIENLPLSV